MAREELFVEKLIDMTNDKLLVWSYRPKNTTYTSPLETVVKKAVLHVSPTEIKIELLGEGSPVKIPMNRMWPEKLYAVIAESKKMPPEVEIIIDNFLKND